MSFDEAMEMAETMDLPDGAFWAMVHELAGLDYGEGFDLLAPKGPAFTKKTRMPRANKLHHKCNVRGKRFKTRVAKKCHGRDAHNAQEQSR